MESELTFRLSGKTVFLQFKHDPNSKELDDLHVSHFINASKDGLTIRMLSSKSTCSGIEETWIIEAIDVCTRNALLSENSKLKQRVKDLEDDMNKVGSIINKWQRLH